MSRTQHFGWRHQFVQTNRIRLHCVTQGEGELVILLHGFLEFWYSWRYQIPALAKRFKVLVPDLRGYNDSDKPADGYDLDTLSADIQGLIQELGYDRAHIVGHDWGGTIAWHLAQRYPQWVDRLVVLNAAHPVAFQQALLSNLDQIRRSWYLFAIQIPDLPELLIQQNLQALLGDMFRQQAVRKGAFSSQDTQLYQSALSKPGVIKAAMSYYRQFLSAPSWMRSLRQTPKQILTPTLVLWGEDDTFLSQSLTHDIEKLVNTLKFKRIPQCGHWIQQEVPLTVNRELLSFL